MRAHILVSIASRFKLDLCLLDDYMISFKTPRFVHACSKNTSTSRWKSAASIANDWNFPGVQVVACVILVCKLKLKFTLMTSSSCSRLHRNTDFTQSRVLRRDRSNICFHRAVLATQALVGGISSTDTMTRSLTPPTSLAHTYPSNMTLVSNDPSWWPIIDFQLSFSYWIFAAGVVVVYDWVLAIGQEIELIWRQRWSLMTVLYLVIRYIGIPYSVATVLVTTPLVSLTDAVSNILNYATNWTNVVITAMLGVIMIARLHAMYQGSRIMLIFLVITFLAVNIACVVLAVIGLALKYVVGEELILSGFHMCYYDYEGDVRLQMSMVWMLNTVWEVLALCLSVWIAVKHFPDLRRLGPSTGSTIGDCFRVLIQSHVLYFAR
ncbi:hypothetical protein CY34DRAFT_752330 [Suillus luteus UH-Slu-Lm8-n1]|uniref:DUF6533 domain-containing protein n=1 Tax=Suillus luteus UH-Slu-Lm8-n1 TaxID=930992 RepID=A0A0D0ALL4_9AGAM|nr:hypothetical protein CY34DRAFT_752330 [Suillus luteus UH-Slu-Lm8-n1]